MSVRELFSAMYTMDFSKSQQFLSDYLTSGKLTGIAEHLHQESETSSDRPLMIRDHVFSFLRAFPVYTALNINSYDLLSSLVSPGTVKQAHSDVVHISQSAFEVGADAFNGMALEIDDLANNQFSVLIGGILKRRTQELDSVRIPLSKMKVSGAREYRVRYNLTDLWRTTYGARVLIGIGLSSSEHVIGQIKWAQLSRALEQLGYRPENILDEVTEAAWGEITASQKSRPNTGSRELSMLGRLRSSILNLGSRDTKTMATALSDIADLGSVSCSRKIAGLARQGIPNAITLLGDVGSQNDEQTLESLLTSKAPEIRESAARALSKISSRGVLGSLMRLPEVIEGDLSVQFALDEYYRIACSENRLARLDAMKAVSSIDSEKAEQTLLLIFEQLDAAGRIELLNLAQDMRRPMAALVVKRALEEQEDEVRFAAIKVAGEIWPEEEL